MSCTLEARLTEVQGHRKVNSQADVQPAAVFLLTAREDGVHGHKDVRMAELNRWKFHSSISVPAAACFAERAAIA